MRMYNLPLLFGNTKTRLYYYAFFFVINGCFICCALPSSAQDADYAMVFPVDLDINDEKPTAPKAPNVYDFSMEWRSCATIQQAQYFLPSSLEELIFSAFFSAEKATEKAIEESYALPTLQFTKIPESYRVHTGKTFQFGAPSIQSDCPEGYDMTTEDFVVAGDYPGTMVHSRIWTIADACGSAIKSCKQTIYVLGNGEIIPTPIEDNSVEEIEESQTIVSKN